MRSLATPALTYRPTHTLTLALSLACVAAFSSPARASSVQVLSLDEMARRATVIAEATVVDVRVERDVGPQGDRPATYTTLRVDDAIEGASRGELLVVFQPGAPDPAMDGGRVSWIAGQRAYRVGERVVFFGVRHARAGLDVVVHLTLGYGTFDVGEDGAVRERVLDVLDARTQRAPRARSFASRAAFRERLDRALP